MRKVYIREHYFGSGLVWPEAVLTDNAEFSIDRVYYARREIHRDTGSAVTRHLVQIGSRYRYLIRFDNGEWISERVEEGEAWNKNLPS